MNWIDKTAMYLYLNKTYAGVAQLARASAFQAEGRRFESGFPLQIFLP